MTGAQFLEKVRGIKEITNIGWNWTGDYFTPDVVYLSVIADGEPIEIYYPSKSENEDVKFIQFCFMALLLNRYMELIGDDYRMCFASDIPKAVEYIQSLNK